MKIFLVGGAVRDQQLGLPVKDRDWLVTGATPEQMVQQGFRPVGQAFPVFLHPKTGEEYALARTERKSGHGYGGFVFHTSPDITVEQDLQRRDLTINAMAKDDHGNIIDPYGGRQDISDRVLRHVSPAFREDPLRILRVARFAARFGQWGFSVADDTLQLMKEMVAEGEADWLVPERVWQETVQALASDNPERYFQVLSATGAVNIVMPEVADLFSQPGSIQAEAVQMAAAQGKDTVVRFACAVARQQEQGHRSVERLCQRIKVPVSFKEVAIMTAKIVRFWFRDSVQLQERLTLLQQADGFRRPERFQQIIAACGLLARAAGREGQLSKTLPDDLARCQAIDVQVFVKQGLTGKQLADALNRARMAAMAFGDQGENLDR